MVGAMIGGMMPKHKDRPNVDIRSEFELIQQKKSKLSSNNRDWVCRQFLKRYQLINQ